jgi:hypothetical protein
MGGLFGRYPRVGEDPGSACRPVEIDKPLDLDRSRLTSPWTRFPPMIISADDGDLKSIQKPGNAETDNDE